MTQYRTIDIAREAGIHVNTVRFYERMHLIAPVPRAKNNYRVFSPQHLYQILVLRCIFINEWPGTAVRKKSYAIIEAMKVWQIIRAEKLTGEYIAVIQREIRIAGKTAGLLKNWGDLKPGSIASTMFEIAEVSSRLNITRETIRNWERNKLIDIPRKGKNKKRYFTNYELNRLSVIYMLRQSGYSISAIYNALHLLDRGKAKRAVSSLKKHSTADILTSGDRLIHVLNETEKKARHIQFILAEIKRKKI